MLRLQGYDFKVVYRPGKTNIADALSRLNSVRQLDRCEEYDFIRATMSRGSWKTTVPCKVSDCMFSFFQKKSSKKRG